MIMIIGPKPGIKRKTKSTAEQPTSKRKKGKNKGTDDAALADKALEEANAAAEAEADTEDTSTPAPAEKEVAAKEVAAKDAPAPAVEEAPAAKAAPAES
jgi:hypothetical protein